VHVFSADGDFILSFGGEGSGDGEFRYPKGLAFDRFRNLYVADPWNHRVQKFRTRMWTAESHPVDGDGHRGATPSSAFSVVSPSPLGATYVTVTTGVSLSARIRVFDLRGRLIRTVFEGELPAGKQRFHWAGTNETGREVSAGVYFIRMESGDASSDRKIVLLR
jgi:DNA-binding beta-propeller fold protein YncE